jgi:hypothetical protein
VASGQAVAQVLSLSRAEHESGALEAEHREGRHALHAEFDACVWNLDLLNRLGHNLVGYHDMSMSVRVGEEELITALPGPGCELIGTAEKLVARLLDAENRLATVSVFDPVPERWAEVKP